MKSFSFLCLLLSGLCFASSGDNSASDTSLIPVTIQRRMASGDFSPGFNGFQGHHFGVSHFGMLGLKLRSSRKGIDWYNVDRPQIGRAWMKNLGFGFRNDKFYGVMAVPQDYGNFLELKSLLYSVYGPPLEINKLPSSITYIWKVLPGVILKLNMYWGHRRMEDADMIMTLISAPILLGKSYR